VVEVEQEQQVDQFLQFQVEQLLVLLEFSTRKQGRWREVDATRAGEVASGRRS
jgi:hypothetical protein